MGTPALKPLPAALQEERPFLLQMARRLAGTPEADDLVQDVLVYAVANLQNGPLPRNLRGWLVTVLHHKFFDSVRRVKTAPLIPVLNRLPPYVEYEEKPWEHITLEQLQSAVDALSPALSEAYSLQLKGLRIHEIAQRLNAHPSTIATRLMRARKDLREILIRRHLE